MSRRHQPEVTFPAFLLDGTPSCADADPNIFFPVDEEDKYGKPSSVYKDLNSAKAVCIGCPLRFECLDFAIKNYEIGIWGGTTETQRAALRRGRHRII